MVSNENRQEEFGEKSEKAEERENMRSLFNARLIALFVLGVLIGITVKTQASKTITMGYDDYKLKNTKQGFDLSAERRETAVQESEEGIEAESSSVQEVTEDESSADNGQEPIQEDLQQ